MTGIGPQIGYLFPVGDKQGYLNLKGYYEFDAARRPEGWKISAYIRYLAGGERSATTEQRADPQVVDLVKSPQPWTLSRPHMPPRKSASLALTLRHFALTAREACQMQYANERVSVRRGHLVKVR